MKTSIRTDTKLWVFEETDQPITVGVGSVAKGERVYVFGYTWFEARTGALAALQRSSGLVHGREIENVKEHIVEEGSTIAFVDRGSTWFEIVETCRQMSGEEARTLLAFPSPFPAESGSEKTRGEEGILPLGDFGHAAEPAVEPEPASPCVYPSSEALRALLNANADYNADWPEIARIASQAIEALEAMEAKVESPAFGEASPGGASRVGPETIEILRLREEVKTVELARFRAARQSEDYRVLGAKQEKELHAARQSEKDCRVRLEAAVIRIYEMERGEDLLKAQKEVAYDERNRLVAVFASMALALGWNAGISLHEDPASGGTSSQEEWDPEWRTLVMVETPEGQASWHFHDSQKHLVAHLPSYVAKWDGHDAPTKYMRLERLGCIRFEPAKLGWETAAKECVTWSKRRAKEAEQISRASGNHTSSDLWTRLRAEAEGFAELGARFRGFAQLAPARAGVTSGPNQVREQPAQKVVPCTAGVGDDDEERLEKQIERLADFIMSNVPGEPSQNEGAVDTAIRIIIARDAEILRLNLPIAAEYERGKEEADELHLRMLELRDAEAYRRGLREAAEECRALSSKIGERAKAFADAPVGTAQWVKWIRYTAKSDAAHECEICIEALAKKVST